MEGHGPSVTVDGEAAVPPVHMRNHVVLMDGPPDRLPVIGDGAGAPAYADRQFFRKNSLLFFCVA